MIPPANEYKVTDTYSAEEAMERLRAFVARRPSYPDHAVIAHESHADMIRMGHLRALASVRPEAARMTECLGHPATYWFDAFKIAEGLRADAERRVQEEKPDAARFRWLLKQPPSVRDAVLSPPIPPEHLESPETWDGFVRAAIDSKCGPQVER